MFSKQAFKVLQFGERISQRCTLEQVCSRTVKGNTEQNFLIQQRMDFYLTSLIAPLQILVDSRGCSRALADQLCLNQ